jgi:hypothetical protein
VTVSDTERVRLTRPNGPARVVDNINSVVVIKKPAVAAAANKLQKPRIR